MCSLLVQHLLKECSENYLLILLFMNFNQHFALFRSILYMDLTHTMYPYIHENHDKAAICQTISSIPSASLRLTHGVIVQPSHSEHSPDL